eukprot:5324412-Prorocentrum_lima.AAC.1
MEETLRQGGSGLQNTRVTARESEYMKRGRQNLALSPERGDAFSDQTPARSFRDIMAAQDAAREAKAADLLAARETQDLAQQEKAKRQA